MRISSEHFLRITSAISRSCSFEATPLWDWTGSWGRSSLSSCSGKALDLGPKDWSFSPPADGWESVWLHVINEGFIDGKGRAGIDDLISWITISLLAKADRWLGPGKTTTRSGGRLNPPCFAEMLCDGLCGGARSLVGRSSACCPNRSASWPPPWLCCGTGKSGSPRLHLITLFPWSSSHLIWWPYFECVLCIDESNGLWQQAHNSLLGKVARSWSKSNQ